MDNNLCPGNKKSSLTSTLKNRWSCSERGITALLDIYRYTEPVTAKGFVFMDSPGYDSASTPAWWRGEPT
ncbi:MAG: UxaA family hydrolase [Magnetovibrio sp.]|nr:UxaA family hydrolase [Magnetovibrio sp.]